MSDELEALLAKLTPEERARLGARLISSDAPAQAPGTVHGTLTVSDDARINGVVVAVNLGRIIYGRDVEEDERRRLVWYLARLAAKLARLPLRGLEERLDQGDGLALPHIYVLLATEALVEVARGTPHDLRPYFADDKPDAPLLTAYAPDHALPTHAIVRVEVLAPARTVPQDTPRVLWRSRLATEALHQHPHLVLLGDPGGGKTTFLRHLAWALAQRGLDHAEAHTALFGWDDQRRLLPIVVPLRTLAGRLATTASPDEGAAQVHAALCAEIASYGITNVDDLVNHALTSGSALLLFDGLDEVPLDALPAQVADRTTTLTAIRSFAQLHPTTRVVLTCRTRAWTDDLRAHLRWPVETLAPFTFGQVRAFTTTWYAEIAAHGELTTEDAAQLAQRLVATIRSSPKLRAMAQTPLLLTMMALVLYNRGELPRDRPQLYERILDLLLGQWDKVRNGQSLAEAIGRADWTSERIRPVLDELSYTAHQQAQSADGRGRIARSALYTTLIDFFTRVQVTNPGGAAWACLNYFAQRSGLLAPDTNDTYVYAHLTLQEHCAGRHIALGSDNPIGLMMQHRAEDRWREPIFLGAGLLRPVELNALLDELLDREEDGQAKALARWYRDVILAAEIGKDREWDALRTHPQVKVKRVQDRLRDGLVALLHDATHPLPVSERVRAGFLLGDLGDPRYPVTIEQWQAEIARAQAGEQGGYFCPVAAGSYRIGSADDDCDAEDDERPQHIVTFDTPFLIGRYPITNDQWRAWVQAGGRPSRFTDDVDVSHPNQPVVGVDWYMSAVFCTWLSEHLGVTVRLPTEEEWEAAARGSAARRYPWGDAWQEDHAASAKDQDIRGAQWSVPVGCYPAGAAACGALDMAGNVREWTASVWRSYPGTQQTFTNEEIRVLRGGGYYSRRISVRCGARGSDPPDFDGIALGIRVVVAPRRAR